MSDATPQALAEPSRDSDTVRAVRAAVVDARAPAATQPLLGLPPFRRVLAAAHAAGCAPLFLLANEGQRDALLAQCQGDPRLAGASVQVGEDPEGLALDGAAVIDASGVEALLRGATPAGTYAPADAPPREKKRALLRSLANPADGFVDTWINRPISRHITRALVGTGISPNAVTVLACLIGLAGVACIASREFTLGIVGALVFQLSAAVDCVDGEIARLTHRSSPFGARLDIALDNLVHLALFAAMAWASVPLLGTTGAVAAGAVAGVGGMVAFLLVYHLTFGNTQGTSSRLKRILDRFTNRDFSLAVIAVAALGRWDVLLILIAVGSNLFWLFLLASSLRARRES